MQDQPIKIQQPTNSEPIKVQHSVEVQTSFIELNPPTLQQTKESLPHPGPVTHAYELWLKAGSASTLSHDVTAAVAMTITCSDGTDQITSSYNVDIFDAVPVPTNFAGTSGPLGDLSLVGTSVHQFTITDQDDAISFSINAQEVAKFGITKVDTATGAQRFDVMTIATLDYDSATSYTITVTCTDAINPVTSSRTINLADDKPVFSGLRLRCRWHVMTTFRRRRYFARSASRTPTTRVLSRA
ncbi:hypothetical protein DPMN_020878 [Dreissena polymorpha]|uniref:Cadherin domain-containing protein n=1 Tax=Dreissena polymorpha TaxID=45954 RepID=A0A9D4S8N0_DREPO|nr:hypothetical protein DPMN_020878 [Dreissena polymorpha]